MERKRAPSNIGALHGRREPIIGGLRAQRQFDAIESLGPAGLNKCTGAREVVGCQVLPSSRKPRAWNGGFRAVALHVADDAEAMFAHQAHVRGVRFAIDQVRPLPDDEFPERF
jgi:hypothetical protein